MDVIYENIKRYRKLRYMTQEELAAKLEYQSRGIISQIETGMIDLPYSRICAIAEALDVPVPVLIGCTSEEEYDLCTRVYALPPDARKHIMLEVDFLEETAQNKE